MADNLKEYLIKLGFDVDDASQHKMLSAVREGTLQANILFQALKGAVEAFGTAVFKVANHLDTLYWESRRIKDTVGNIQAFEAAAAQSGSTAEAAGASLDSFFKAIRFNPGLDQLARSYSHVSQSQWQMIGTSQKLVATVKGMANLPPWVQNSYMSMLGIDFNTWQAILSGEYEEHLKRFQSLQKLAGLDPQVAAENAKKFTNIMGDFGNELEIIWEKIQGNVVNGGGAALQKLLQWLSDHSSAIADSVIKVSNAVIDFVNNGLNKLLKDPDIEKGFTDFIRNVTNLATKLDDLAKGFDKIWHFFTDPVDANWFAKYIFGHPNAMTNPPVQPLPPEPDGRTPWQQWAPKILGGKDAPAGEPGGGILGHGLRGTPSATGPQSSNAPIGNATATNADVERYIRQAATARGIDPNVAIAVARSEGLKGFDPSRGKWSSGSNDYGTSYGPFQQHFASNIPGMRSRGIGDDMLRDTGVDARKIENWKSAIDYSLDAAAKGGWGPWHGAQAIGVADWQGLNGAKSIGFNRPWETAGAPANPFAGFGITPAQAADVSKSHIGTSPFGALSRPLGGFAPTNNNTTTHSNQSSLNQKTNIHIYASENEEVGSKIAKRQSSINAGLLRDLHGLAVG